MDAVKTFLSMLAGSFLSIAYPVFNPAMALGLLFTLDVVSGIICDKRLAGEGFSFKKFMRAIQFLCLYMSIIGSLYFVCYWQNDMDEGTLLLKTITYVCIYFYFSNTFKNLTKSYPENRFFSFLYFVACIDTSIVKKIPSLSKFMAQEKKATRKGSIRKPVKTPSRTKITIQKRNNKNSIPNTINIKKTNKLKPIRDVNLTLE